MEKLKVWGGTLDGINRFIVAAKTQKEAAQLLGVTTKYLREYGCITGNKKEIELATSEPGKVFKYRGRFIPKYIK